MAQTELSKLAMMILGKFEPAQAKTEAEALFEGDVKGTEALIGAVFGALNAKAAYMTSLVNALSKMSEKQRHALFTKASKNFDGKAIGEATTAYSQAMITLYKEQPDLMKSLSPELQKMVTALDTGKFREGVCALSDYNTALTLALVEPVMDNPVALANLFGIVVPLLNNRIALFARITQLVDFPPEVLASGTFNTLSEVDLEQLSALLNHVFSLIRQLHHGNMILGRDEPKLKSVLTDLVDTLVQNIEGENAAAAIVALSEDGEVVCEVLTALVMRDADMLVRLCKTGMILRGAAIKSLANFLTEAAGLPDETVLKIADEMYAHCDAKNIGRIVTEGATFFNRMFALNPKLREKAVRDFIGALDTDAVSTLLFESGTALVDVAKTDPKFTNAMSPEQMGARINRGLIRFNRFLDHHPEGIGDYLKRMLGAVDTTEMEVATKRLVGAVTDAIFASGKMARAILGPWIKVGWKMVKYTVSLTFRGLFGKNK